MINKLHQIKFQHFFILAVFAAIGVCILILSRNVFADEYGGGTSTEGGTSCTSSNYVQKDQKGYHNCCMKGRSCPHYIHIPFTDKDGDGVNEAFVNAVNNGEDADGFKHGGDGFDNTEAYNRCKKDPNGVVIVGTDYGTLRATNWHAPSKRDYKALTGWGDLDLGWDRKYSSGYTFKELKTKILNMGNASGKSYAGNGSDEYYLAFFCQRIIEEPETIFNANTKVRVTVTLPNNLPTAVRNYYRGILGGSDSKHDTFSIFPDGGGANWDTDNKVSEETFNIVNEMFNGEDPPEGTEVKVNFIHKIDVSPKTSADGKPNNDRKRKTEWNVSLETNSNVDASRKWLHKRSKTSGTATFSDSSAQTVADWIDNEMISFTIKANKTYKVCETLKYGYQTENGGKITAKPNGTNRTNKACITITGVVPPDDCRWMPNNASWSTTYGHSDAQSWVRKSDQSNWSHLVYARPRDKVSFCHAYYPYAHSAKGSLSSAGIDQTTSPGTRDHGRHYPAYYVKRTCSSCGDWGCSYWDCSYWARTKTSNASLRRISRSNVYDYCQLKAGSTWGGGDYLFEYGKDNKDQKLCNGSTGKIHTSKEIITFFSPYKNSTTYGCNATSKGLYQIVGYDPRSQCSRDGTLQVSSSHDVGRTFYQYITYGGTITASSNPINDYDHGLSAHYSDFYLVTQRYEGYTDGTPANVVVPYNFNTTAKISGNSSSIVYPGEPISFNTNVEITPRYNIDVTPTQAYATITPPSSKIITVQFTLDPGVAQPNDLKGGITWGGSESSVADYIRGKTGSGLRSYVTQQTASGSFNKGDKTKGLTGSDAITANANYTIPDDEAGVKYCVAVAVYPADSHNKYIGEDLPSGANNDGSGQEGRTNWRWRVSDIKCTTIAKKPNTQIWGNGLYSADNVVSSTATKCVSWTLSTSSGCGNNKRRFGSWAENEIVANGIIVNFASANGYGYDRYFRRNDYYNTGTLSAGLPGGSTSTQFRDIAKQTISNNQPGSSYGGLANIDISTDALDRIVSRYADSQPKGFAGGVYDSNSATSTAGSIYLGRGAGTVVIYSTNDFTIDDNIEIENYGYDNIADIPQVLIIAPNIFIASNVTRVDAWLITTDRVNGTVNTCKEFSVYRTPSNGACSQPLVINGPIIAMRTLFYRTAGAGSGNQSINPAERINLSAANYLWAYSQAEQLQQAFTTYTRELAPRY